LSVITTASYASTKEKKAMCQGFVFGFLVIVLMFVEFGFVVALIGGAIFVGTLAWLGVIVKSTNDTLGYDIPDR
jgi:hypothetical protein